MAEVMSKRDKKLIYFCAMFAAAALTYMLAISPLRDSITELMEERNSMQMRLDDMRYEAAMEEKYNGWLEDSTARYLENRTLFEDVYATENADRIFTEEVLRNNMTPLSFNITERNYERRLVPYGDEFRGAEGPEYSEYIYLRNITFTCSGTFDRALKFVDELKDRNGVLISSVSFINTNGEYSDVNSQVTLSVSFDIYTYDKDGFEAANGIAVG